MISPRLLPPILVLLAAIQLFTGLWQLVSPGNFYESIATYGSQNDHFVRDISSIYIAMGLGLLISARIASWRVPVLFLVTVQYFVHTVNHAFDVGDADSVFLGVFNLLTLAAVTIVFAALLNLAHAQAKRQKESEPATQS